MEVTLERRLAVQQKVYSVDVRNHHRICDAQEYLLNTLVKLEEKFIDKYVIDVTIQQNVLNILKYLFHRGKTRGESCCPSNALITGCKKSSKNLGWQNNYRSRLID